MVSMPMILRVLLIGASLFVLIYVTYNSIKTKMDIKFAVLWILWAIVIFILGLFPSWALAIAQAMGFQAVSNFVFVIMIAILFGFTYYTYVKMSNMDKEIKNLNYEVAILRKKIEEQDISK